MKKNVYIFGGMMSGLAIGGLFDYLFGFTFFWLVFILFGIQSGIIFKQREELKELKK